MRIPILLACTFLIVTVLAAPGTMQAASAPVGVEVSIRIAPPILPVYAQPLCPGAGYIWESGYWAYGIDGYYWVPGIWILPPRAGLLWTPGYWGFS
jgi:WXXGXW repeat (2 copies)